MANQKQITEGLTQSDLAEAIRAATEQVFSTMLGLELTSGDVFVEQQDAVPASPLASVIGLAGAWVGSGSLFCTDIGEDVLGSMAELTNMIIGNMKTRLGNRVGALGLSTPTVTYGRDSQTRSARHQEWTVVPFSLDGDRMCVQMCLIPNPGAGEKPTRAAHPIPHALNV